MAGKKKDKAVPFASFRDWASCLISTFGLKVPHTSKLSWGAKIGIRRGQSDRPRLGCVEWGLAQKIAGYCSVAWSHCLLVPTFTLILRDFRDSAIRNSCGILCETLDCPCLFEGITTAWGGTLKQYTNLFTISMIDVKKKLIKCICFNYSARVR